MARLNVNEISASTTGIGSVIDFIVAAKKLSSAHNGAPVRLTFKGFPISITKDTDENEATLTVERSTGLLGRENIPLFATPGRSPIEDIVTGIYYSAEATDC